MRISDWSSDVCSSDLARLGRFEPVFMQAYQERMAAKLGWRQWLPGDETLVDDWWGLLHTQRSDFTLSFRRLAHFKQDSEPFLSLCEDKIGRASCRDRMCQDV